MKVDNPALTAYEHKLVTALTKMGGWQVLMKIIGDWEKSAVSKLISKDNDREQDLLLKGTIDCCANLLNLKDWLSSMMVDE